MSARRQARARDAAGSISTIGGVPRSLLIGPCIEVWGSDKAEARDSGPGFAARRRFSAVRRWWLAELSLEPCPEAFAAIPPTGAPWSTEYLIYRGQEQRAGQSLTEAVAARLARAGCTIRDLPDLRAEALELYERALAARTQTLALTNSASTQRRSAHGDTH